MGEFQLPTNGKPVKFARATESYGKNNFGEGGRAALAIDGDPQTGWSTAGGEGERHEAVFVLAEPLANPGELQIKMMFGRHYACSLGRFRIAVTAKPGGTVARALPEEAEGLLLIPDGQLTAAQREKLREDFLFTAPELADARGEIERLRKPPTHPTTMVMRERPPGNPLP